MQELMFQAFCVWRIQVLEVLFLTISLPFLFYVSFEPSSITYDANRINASDH
jgi:hypothetical protein